MVDDIALQYSAYLRKANGARARVIKSYNEATMDVNSMAWQWCTSVPGKWAGGSWGRIDNCDALMLAVFLSGCRLDPYQGDEHPGPPQEDPDNG